MHKSEQKCTDMTYYSS